MQLYGDDNVFVDDSVHLPMESNVLACRADSSAAKLLAEATRCEDLQPLGDSNDLVGHCELRAVHGVPSLRQASTSSS